jgi:hypothetical protein
MPPGEPEFLSGPDHVVHSNRTRVNMATKARAAKDKTEIAQNLRIPCCRIVILPIPSLVARNEMSAYKQAGPVTVGAIQ